MVEVKIYYRPWWFLGYRKVIEGSFPERYDELTGKQLIGVVKVLRGMVSGIGFLHIMTGISKRMLKRLDPYERFKLMELFEVFNEPKPYHEFIIKKTGTGGRLLAPKPKLKGVTFGQFIFADTYFGSYQESNSANDLHRFVASMYLQEGVQFDEKLIDNNCKLLKDVDPETLEAIAINYLLIREWLGLAYPLVFVKEDDKAQAQAQDEEEKKGQAKAEAKKKRAYDPTGWIKVFDGLVGDDIVNQDKYANMPLHNVFRYMTGRIKENMKRKRGSKQ